MPRSFVHALAVTALVAVAVAGEPVFTGGEVEAAQPYTCICKGQKKRFLASTRHCEVRLKLPKSRTCSKTQIRVIYGLACARQGCKLAPLN